MELYDDYGAPRTDLPDGVYFDLPEAVYFAQARLGSSDIGTLYEQRFGWWWQSRWNPHKEAKEFGGAAFGHALHKMLLEGIATYRDTYAVAPDPANYGHVLYTVDDYKEELKSRGVLPKPMPKNQQEWLDEIRLRVPREVCVAWKNVMADFDKARGDRPPISPNDNRNLLIMYDLIANDDTQAGAELRQILSMDTTWPTLAEVSLLWTDQWGHQRRSRFDKLVPNFTLDLKSLSNWGGKPLDMGISDHVMRYGYDIQMADYHIARLTMGKMVRDMGGAVIHGGDTEQRAWLEAMIIKEVAFDWVWLFYQVPDAKLGRAPVVFPLRTHWQSDYHLSGHRKAYKAMQIYKEGLAKFGLHKPWGEIRPVHYTKEGTSTSVFLSAWGWDNDPVDNEHILDR